MRLSEAIRLGAMLGPQVFGSFFDDQSGSCALGAVAKATNAKGCLSDHWPDILNRSVCPAGCPTPYGESVAHIIRHLNDECRWTRERIADWVQTLEEAQAPQAVERSTDENSAVLDTSNVPVTVYAR